MGWWWVAYFVVTIIASVIISSSARGGGAQPDMEPASLDSFEPTRANEGMVVPIVYGTCRVPGNLLWYGNLKTKQVTETVETGGGSGGGGGSETFVTGYKYYMDVWQGIAIGQYTLEGVYQNNKPTNLDPAPLIFGKDDYAKSNEVTFNDGTEDTYPTQPGANANRLPGIAHIFIGRFFIGENVTYLPTLHFVIKRIMPDCPVNHADMETGTNPAAIIYDLLIHAGVTDAEIDLNSFNIAAEYWYTEEFGLNISFSQQKSLRAMIDFVLSYVGGAVTINSENKWALKAFTPDDPVEKNLNEDDFIEFQLTRRSLEDTYNSFCANYTDKDQHFTKRSIRCFNNASIKQLGYKRTKTVNLDAYRGIAAASKRLFQIVKQESYPEMQLQFKTNLKFSQLPVGGIVEISHADYGFSNAKFRILSADLPGIESNSVSFTASQVMEGIFDTHFETGGDVQWENPDYVPSPCAYQRCFEMPYNQITGHSAVFLILAARQHAYEGGFILIGSSTGTDYAMQGKFSGFSQRGTLDQAYTSNTDAIDDDVGILYTPSIDDPEFITISRAETFGSRRCAIIDDEIIAFQSIQPEGQSSYRLTGCIRGTLGTSIQTHATGAEIWLAVISKNITEFVASDFYIKILPMVVSDVLDPADATAIHVTCQNKALTPWPPGRIVANRSESLVTVEYWPRTQDHIGAGMQPADTQTDQYPFAFDGDFEIFTDVGGDPHHQFISGTQVVITQTGTFTLSIKCRRDGYLSEAKTLFIGSANGEYIS